MISLDAPKYVEPVTCDTVYNGSKRNVACVWTGTKYGPEYVLRLKKAVDRNLSGDYTFFCFTDEANYRERGSLLEEVGIHIHAKALQHPGWWGKLEMFDFRNWNQHDRILFLDLDVVITGPLDEFFMSDHHTTMIANFGVNFRHAKYNSSVVVWDGHGPASHIYDEFSENPGKVMKTLHGDQCFMWRVMRDDVRVWPKNWVMSYKYEVRRHSVPKECRVVVFHGDPKPDVVHDGFVIDNWLHQD